MSESRCGRRYRRTGPAAQGFPNLTDLGRRTLEAKSIRLQHQVQAASFSCARSAPHDIPVRLTAALLKSALHFFPAHYRDEYGLEHADVLRQALAAAAARGWLPLLLLGANARTYRGTAARTRQKLEAGYATPKSNRTFCRKAAELAPGGAALCPFNFYRFSPGCGRRARPIG